MAEIAHAELAGRVALVSGGGRGIGRISEELGAVRFLVSDGAGYVTGQRLAVDGGGPRR